MNRQSINQSINQSIDPYTKQEMSTDVSSSFTFCFQPPRIFDSLCYLSFDGQGDCWERSSRGGRGGGGIIRTFVRS